MLFGVLEILLFCVRYISFPVCFHYISCLLFFSSSGWKFEEGLGGLIIWDEEVWTIQLRVGKKFHVLIWSPLITWAVTSSGVAL